MQRDPSPNPDSVFDEASFIAFATELLHDRRLADQHRVDALAGAPRGWQNDTVSDFLDSALAWVDDTQFGRTQGVADDASPWRRLALFLYLGKIYE